MHPPHTPADTQVDTLHGTAVPDPYRWLESGEDPAVRQWSIAQNTYTKSRFENADFARFQDELKKSFDHVVFTNPLPVNGRYFYRERKPGQDQMVLLVQDDLDLPPRVLVDPNGKVSGNTISLDYWQPSRSGKYIAYGLSEKGTEMATLFVKNVETGEKLSDEIVHCRYASVVWLPDDSGFFYTRNARPGTVPANEAHMHTKVFFHRLGGNPNDDEMVFGHDRPLDDMIGLDLSLDGKLLMISATQNWSSNDLFAYWVEEKRLEPFVVGVSANFGARLLSDTILIHTNYKANNFRVLAVPCGAMKEPLDSWQEFIPEKESVLQGIAVTQDKIFAEYLVNAASRVVEYGYDGTEKGQMQLPAYSTLGGISGRRTEREFFYSVESYTFPPICYRYDPKKGTYHEFRRTESPINPDDFDIVQEWCASKDGTSVPMFIVSKKGLIRDGSHPSVLMGYGGFANSETPGFLKSWIPWLTRGGIFAVANIRGGSEFGRSWHLDATKEHKQRSYDDFIAVARHLCEKDYTKPERLGIIGGSNGGLLVSAVAVQEPTLFAAVCAKVPLTDMVRFPLFGMASRWVHEYGDPSIEKDFKNILLWSPYQNVRPGIRYPTFLITTGEKDSRVDPLHARKMAAILQANSTVSAYLLTEMDAGHGAGKPVSKTIETQALVLSFFAQTLGVSGVNITGQL